MGSFLGDLSYLRLIHSSIISYLLTIVKLFISSLVVSLTPQDQLGNHHHTP